MKRAFHPEDFPNRKRAVGGLEAGQRPPRPQKYAKTLLIVGVDATRAAVVPI
jgi:hypothetical protein